MANEPNMVLCPVCRTPIPDYDYYRHAQEHQVKKVTTETAKK